MNRLEVFQKKLLSNQTKPESFFYQKAKEYFSSHQHRFRFPIITKQLIVGWYIADFALLHKHLIIELDGKQHFSLAYQADDILRDGYFKDLGFDVLRYKNEDIYKDIDNILEYIDLWASLENPVSNYFKFRKVVRIQNNLRENGSVNRMAKSKELEIKQK